MELFLNILWVTIALGAFGAWRIIWNRQPREFSRAPLQEWTAFACALVFVFFAVSLSDDLRAAAVLADDCASGRHHSMVWSCGHAPHPDVSAPHAPFAAAARPAARFPEPVEIAERIAPAAITRASKTDRSSAAVRGPPLVSL
ncbi:MAG TPA: hypothetical protein VJW93_02985 [Candidatus Acidoferrales bacterium]|nr:hypothetical protein [Candidatus Acidoferrales bacterium]